MSASNPTASRTGIPAVNYYSWSGKEGRIGNKVGTEDLVNVPFPLRILPLDFDAFCVENAGFDVKQGIRKVKSTIAHPTYQKKITIRYDDIRHGETEAQRILFEGPWYAGAAKSEKLAATKVKYNNLLYFIEAAPDKSIILSRFKFHGTASYAFSEARKAAIKEAADRGVKATQEDFIYTITGATEITTSVGTKTLVPVFTWEPISEKAKALQIEEDIKLQALFAEYFGNGAQPEETVDVSDAAPSHFTAPAVAQPALEPAPAVQGTPPPPPVVDTSDLPF